MSFRDSAIFRISRDEVGGCTLELCRHILWVFPYWVSLPSNPITFTECLEFIEEWCCERNIGNAIIYDPTGANKVMSIKYRKYSGEKLNKRVNDE